MIDPFLLYRTPNLEDDVLDSYNSVHLSHSTVTGEVRLFISQIIGQQMKDSDVAQVALFAANELFAYWLISKLFHIS